MRRGGVGVEVEADTDTVVQVRFTAMRWRARAAGASEGVAPVLAVFLAAMLSACSRPPADNLLFVSFDTTRADHISAYGYRYATTPNIDALAREGVLFERAFTHVPSTLPAHTTIFTGLLPPQHGVRCNGWFRVPAEHTTLAETLAAQGFATGAVIGALPLDDRFGLDQGFETYDARFRSSADATDRPAGAMDSPGRWLVCLADDTVNWPDL